MMTFAKLANSIHGEIQAGFPGKDLSHDHLSIATIPLEVTKGSIFIALTGPNDRDLSIIDGNLFIKEAIEKGASCIISEAPPPEFIQQESDIGWIKVENIRKSLSRAARYIYGNPSERIKVIGICGSNGKTTVGHILNSILEAANYSTSLVSTLGYQISGTLIETDFTTPPAHKLQELLAQAVENHVTHSIIEISSMGLRFGRVNDIQFEIALFTGHSVPQSANSSGHYTQFVQKKSLFEGSFGPKPKISIINLDDPRAEELISACGENVVTYGTKGNADVVLSSEITTENNTLKLNFSAKTPLGIIDLTCPLIGKHNVSNILGAVASSIALGIQPESIVKGIRNCSTIPGRFEVVSTDQDDIAVIVDHAHKPETLASTLQSCRDLRNARALNGSKIITVLGCSSITSRTMRASIGEQAARLSDFVIATSDNPRFEDPILILGDIQSGLAKLKKPYDLIVDRKIAIRKAINMDAQAGDIVLISGKGNEPFQVIATERIPFDDRQVAREALKERRN